MFVDGYRGTLWERFWSKVDTSGGSDACWPWVGAKSLKRSGTLRGVIWLKLVGRSRIVLAHRFALCLTFGGSDLDDLMRDYDARFGARLQTRSRAPLQQPSVLQPASQSFVLGHRRTEPP